MHLPSVLAAPFIVASTDMVMTIPRRAAQILGKSVPIVMHPLPLEVAPYRLKAFCHAKRFNESACKWMRETILRVMTDEEAR